LRDKSGFFGGEKEMWGWEENLHYFLCT
jgi:hypothetical protein